MQKSKREECTYGALNYVLERKSIKNINLRVRRDGSVYVSAPRLCPKAQIEKFLAQKLGWVLKAQSDTLQKQHLQNALPTPDKNEALRLFNDISARYFLHFAAILNGQMPLIKVRDMKTRWGVCHPKKCTITLNLQLLNKPLAAVEYVILHEYVHFLVSGHGKNFWQTVAAYMPDYKERRRLLK